MKSLIEKSKKAFLAAQIPVRNEKGMELIQMLGLAVIAIVLVGVIYSGLSGNFSTWMNTINTNMTTLLGKFSAGV